MIWILGKINKKSRLNKINKEFTQQIGRIALQIAKGKRHEEETGISGRVDKYLY